MAGCLLHYVPLYMLLLVRASVVIGATKYELEKKTKQEETENRQETKDSGAGA